MAIKSFKDILDNKGYRISSKDRAIFEEGTLQSFFGFTDSDMIEFILYDVNDNQLPQGEYGEKVRYIPMNSDNIKDYFLVADGTKLQAFQFPNEYFIDAERLINEAGYDNGIFKTQITLLNKRIGLNSTNEKEYNHVTSFFQFQKDGVLKRMRLFLDRNVRSFLSKYYKKITGHQTWHKRK